MKTMTKIWILALSVVWLSACAEEMGMDNEPIAEPSPPSLTTPTEQGKVATKPEPPAIPLPENVEVQGDWLFAMELTPENMDLTLHGTSLDRLAGKLSDQEGRREILFYGRNFRTPQTVFKTDWYLPAVGARNSKGEMLVCVNRLVGGTSTLTKGNMPDPSNGVDLVCRWHSARGWSREYTVERTGAALWLSDVVAKSDGSFRIVYSDDGSGFMVDDPDEQRLDGTYRVEFNRGRLSKPELASRFRKP